jgi:hypothetical protein
MAQNHIVAQGEYLSTIAAEYGFIDYALIWNDAGNAQLKALRANPNVLLPGDSVYIPDMQQGNASGATSKRHTFEINQKQLRLRLILEDMYEKPIANTPALLYFDQQQVAATTDQQGKIDQAVPNGLQTCAVVLNGDATPYQGNTFSVKIGHLDPVDTLSGQQGRLNNLGYLAGSSEDPSSPQFLSAVEEFQCDHDLKVDGVIGPATQAKLKTIHGC